MRHETISIKVTMQEKQDIKKWQASFGLSLSTACSILIERGLTYEKEKKGHDLQALKESTLESFYCDYSDTILRHLENDDSDYVYDLFNQIADEAVPVYNQSILAYGTHNPELFDFEDFELCADTNGDVYKLLGIALYETLSNYLYEKVNIDRLQDIYGECKEMIEEFETEIKESECLEEHEIAPIFNKYTDELVSTLTDFEMEETFFNLFKSQLEDIKNK